MCGRGREGREEVGGGVGKRREGVVGEVGEAEGREGVVGEGEGREGVGGAKSHETFHACPSLSLLTPPPPSNPTSWPAVRVAAIATFILMAALLVHSHLTFSPLSQSPPVDTGLGEAGMGGGGGGRCKHGPRTPTTTRPTSSEPPPKYKWRVKGGSRSVMVVGIARHVTSNSARILTTSTCHRPHTYPQSYHSHIHSRTPTTCPQPQLVPHDQTTCSTTTEPRGVPASILGGYLTHRLEEEMVEEEMEEEMVEEEKEEEMVEEEVEEEMVAVEELLVEDEEMAVKGKDVTEKNGQEG
ncbi:hypothetical protein Pmani_013650 [Petrolisthes manimaculis]|uniref:Uncharacterized protein n=1 Tax=Petrolisthes manimaculis TaxID=1843537 RepID=A0AAE1UDE7_9EUCA|nr:hypothetical protein Pmani_013650 [Petrolisthes manimaculis]